VTQEPRDPNAPPQTPEGGSPTPPEQGGAPAQQSWQSQPQQPAAPPAGGGQPAGSGSPAWVGTLTDQTPVPGPAGYFYADVPNRSIAMIIDVIGIVVIQFVLLAVLGGAAIIGGGFDLMVLVANVLAFILWAAYFMYTWVNMRGTIGMKVLGLQIGHQEDGRSLTYEQAAYRFGVLFGPVVVINLLTALVPALGALGLLSFLWLIYVLYTMAQSPTKQGIHDRYGKSMVVKGGRSVA
jgi:uncharacterized RDD family membrane protein YckC